jgi:hypothetical protein
LHAITELRYAASGTCQRNITNQDEQTRAAVTSLAETQQLHEKSWIASDGADVFPDKHYLNGGEKVYQSSVLGMRYAKNTFFNERLNLEVFVEQSLNSSIYTMCCPDLIASILPTEVGPNLYRLAEGKKSNMSFQMLDRSPVMGANNFKSSAQFDVPGFSAIRILAMEQLAETAQTELNTSIATSSDAIGLMLKHVAKITTRNEAEVSYWWTVLNSNTLMPKIGQAGGNREISISHPGCVLTEEVMNNIGILLRLMSDAATWGERTQSALLDHVQAFVLQAHSAGAVFCTRPGQFDPINLDRPLQACHPPVCPHRGSYGFH